jgi:ELWxxDGT repeat protein
VKDINPDGSAFLFFVEFVRNGDAVLFPPTTARELWRSDGTEAGTVMVADSPVGEPLPFTLTGWVLFPADDGEHGEELWRSDGTEAGTVMVADITGGPGASHPHDLTRAGSTVFFVASVDPFGEELWRSDGTDQGTVPITDINASGGATPRLLTAVGDRLFFTADDGEHGVELWKSDGTPDGTVAVRDINLGPGGSWPAFLRNVDGTLYFVADDGEHGVELWKSDGTEDGTMMVADINPAGSAFGTFTFFFSFAEFENALWFAADDGQQGPELWRSDGTDEGTAIVADINPGDEGSPAFSPLGRVALPGLRPGQGRGVAGGRADEINLALARSCNRGSATA